MDKLPDLTIRLHQQKALADIGDYLVAIGLRQPPPDSMITKAAVAAIATGDTTGIVAAMQPFTEVITARTVLGKLRSQGLLIEADPFMPVPVVLDEPDVTWVGEGQPVPLARMVINGVTTTPSKYATFWAATKELFRLGNGRARNLLIRVSTRQLARGEDLKFLSVDAATAAAPAGILNGVSAVPSGSPDDLAWSLQELYADVMAGQAETPVFITSGRGAMFLAASDLDLFADAKLVNGTILGAPLLISAGAGPRLILIDASQLIAYDGGLDVEASSNASIQMLDNPTNSSSTATPTTVVSAFQGNAIVLRFTRYLSWAKLSPAAAAFIDLPVGSPS